MVNQNIYFAAVLADDEISILRELENAIDWNGLGIRLIRLATNGQDALSAILEFRPDFAIIDIKMPDLDGIAVIQKTRKLGITTDFIILSGYDSFSYAKDAIRYGAKAYLLKPLDSSELYDAIYRTCLDRSQQNKGNHSRLYQEKLNLNFLNRLLDSKILEQNMIGQLLQNTGIPVSDSPCYVCVLLYEQKDQQLPHQQLIRCLDEAFSQEKHIFLATRRKSDHRDPQCLRQPSFPKRHQMSGSNTQKGSPDALDRHRGHSFRSDGMLLFLQQGTDLHHLPPI